MNMNINLNRTGGHGYSVTEIKLSLSEISLDNTCRHSSIFQLKFIKSLLLTDFHLLTHHLEVGCPMT